MNIKRFALVTAGVSLLAASTVHAAGNTATATANANARIISPITIAKTTDLNFGDVIAGTGGTVVVDSASVRTSTGGVALGSATGVSAAAFNVTGATNATYTIQLPTTAVTLNGPVAGNTMTVTNFTSNPALTAGALGATGAQALLVGGTLNVASAQPIGAYTGTFSVTVTYN
jgi:hypothetical protein